MYLNALHTLSIVYNDIRFEIIVYITNICQNIVCDVVKRIKNITHIATLISSNMQDFIKARRTKTNKYTKEIDILYFSHPSKMLMIGNRSREQSDCPFL